MLGIAGRDVQNKRRNTITSMHNPFYTYMMTNTILYSHLTSKKKKTTIHTHGNRSEKDSEKNQRNDTVSWNELSHMLRFSCLEKSWGRDVMMVSYKIIGGTETGTRHPLFNVSSRENPSKSSQNLAQNQIKSSGSSHVILSCGIHCHNTFGTLEFYIGPKATGLIQKVHWELLSMQKL